MATDAARDGYLQLIEARPDIGGRYTGVKRVGIAGGDGHFSLVFTAVDNQTGAKIAIKVFRPDRLLDAYRFQCFCREAALLEELKGTPNVLMWLGPRAEFVEHGMFSGIPFVLSFPYFVVELVLCPLSN